MRPVEFWKKKILTCGLLLIILTTLFPFNLDLRENITSFEKIVNSFDTSLFKPDFVTDFPRNVLLFIPLGFGLAASLERPDQSVKTLFFKTIILGFSLSLAVELIQVWYPSRTPSLSDLLANSIGTVAGMFLFLFYGTIILKYLSKSVLKITAFLSTPVLLAMFIMYVGLIVLIAVWMQKSSKLQNWDWTYPLVIGNELTGNRPWTGSISEAHFADQAISESQVATYFSDKDPELVLGDSLIASYRFNENDNKFARVGQLPDLTWYRDPPNLSTINGVELGPENWLVTEGPVTELSQALSETSQLSIITSVASADLEQYGPARILSISEDTSNRNLTIGQNGKDLIVRFRYPIEGQRAIKPMIAVPDIFVDDLMHRIIITYDSVTLRVFVDGLEHSHSISFTPEVMFLHWLIGAPRWHLRINHLEILGYVLFFYVIIFLPAGFLLAYLIVIARKQNRWPRLLLWAGILFPTVILEIALATERTFKPQYFLLGLIVLTLATLVGVQIMSSYTVRLPGYGEQ